ncbi:MAG: hypothetical protein DRG78_01745 [Epsilonproteobacteria bacterium]|nr:MAG: hypothetical protein DRG78_01745 [Campylobacterota bacterium]
MSRDNFTKITIETLKSRVASRCSNPSCRVPTTAASNEHQNKINNIGIAAHINAASIGGPRYCKKMTSPERKSINNAILLCSNCSIKIDKDIKKYTKELLLEWKAIAEQTAQEEMGNKLPSTSDSINTLTSALTGTGDNLPISAISNIHNASNKALERLDSRFIVKSSYLNDTLCHYLSVKEDVDLSMKISSKYTKNYQELINHGTTLKIDTKDISIKGSKLIKTIINNMKDGELTISSSKKKAIQKIWIQNTDSGQIELFDDINGHINYANKSLSFKGHACNKMFYYEYQKRHTKDRAEISLGIDFEKWENIDILSLPYFSKFFSLFSKLRNGWKLFTSLEIDGNKLFSSIGMDISNEEFIINGFNILKYIDNVKQLSIYLNETVLFTVDTFFTEKEFNALQDIVNIINGDMISYQLVNNCTVEFIIDNNNVDQNNMIHNPIPTELKLFDKNSNTKVTYMNHIFNLPPRETILKQIVPKVISPKKVYKDGDIIKIEWVPADNFECSIIFK